VAYQDLSAWLLGKVGLRPRAVRSRLLMLVPIGAALYMFVWPQVVRLVEARPFPALTWHLTTDSFWTTFPSAGVAALTFLVDGFLIVYLLGAKAFCTYGCPYGAIFSAAGRVAPVSIRVTDACEQCGHCTATCTSNVRVHEEVARHGMVVDPGCMKCLDCVSVCPKGALYLGPGRPAVAARGKRKKRRYDLSWPEELSALAVFVAAAYGFRGLYNVVPLLLALGLAVIAAVAALVLVRMVRHRDFALQDRALRRGGALTPRGACVGALAFGFVLFAGHGAFVQFHLREAQRLHHAARALPMQERESAVARTLSHLAAVERWSLVADERALDLQSGTHRLGGDFAAAADWLERSIGLRPTTEKYLELSSLRMHQQQTDRARAALAAALRLDPDNAEAERRLRLIRLPGGR
jgi:Fe-S-cluster-containing hydrogenase component 2